MKRRNIKCLEVSTLQMLFNVLLCGVYNFSDCRGPKLIHKPSQQKREFRQMSPFLQQRLQQLLRLPALRGN